MHTVIAHWFVQPGKKAEALAALKALAAAVEKNEPDTWGYIIHTGGDDSLPPVSDDAIVFIEIYKDQQAFMSHVTGPTYTGFVKDHGDLFVQTPPNKGPFFNVEHVVRQTGFIRPPAC